MPLNTLTKDEKLAISYYVAACYTTTTSIVPIDEAIKRWEQTSDTPWQNIPQEKKERYLEFTDRVFATLAELGE